MCGGGYGQQFHRGVVAHTHTHTAPRVLQACVWCLIALNCGTVFSTQTNVSMAAPSNDRVGGGGGGGGVGNKRERRGVSFLVFLCTFDG